jgi:citrate/tricarballylate utilization protein
LAGPAGQYLLKRRQDAATANPGQQALDNGFLALLFLTSLTGLLLLALRETPAMGTLLLVHLAVVMTLFLTLPYGKFVHGIHRAAALIRYALEQTK